MTQQVNVIILNIDKNETMFFVKVGPGTGIHVCLREIDRTDLGEPAPDSHRLTDSTDRYLIEIRY